MDARDLLQDHFARIRALYADLADGLSPEQAHRRPGGTGNSIAWLLWHLARVQDDHIAALAEDTQAWEDGWAERFGLPFEVRDIGYGHTSEQVDQVRIDDFGLLVDYHEAVHLVTEDYLSQVDAHELDRVVDRHWDPPVTAGVRLVSIVGDCLQHLGQAAYVKGLPDPG